MRTTLLTAAGTFLAGLLGGLGLGLAGMMQPAKVVAFLDVAGDWDPSLAFVMVGAIAVYATVFRLALRRPAPLLSDHFSVPTRRDITPRLVLGGALFGVGWGLAGYCPGPAVASVGVGSSQALVFVASMLGGMALFKVVDRLLERPRGLPLGDKTAA